MAELTRKCTRRLFLLIACILAVGMILTISVLDVSAEAQASFTVTIDSGIEGDIAVTMTNQSSLETLTVPVTAGTAEFRDFYDGDNTYLLKITGMAGYEDFSDIVSGALPGVSYLPSDFDPIEPSLEVTFTFNSDGTITDGISNPIGNGGKITASEGDSPGFIATAKPNYHISSVVIDSAIQTNGTFDNAQTTYSYTFSNINADHSVAVVFSINSYSVAISSAGSGTVIVEGSPTPPVLNVNHGDSLMLTMTPAAGYGVEEVLLDGTPVEGYDLIDGSVVAYSYVLNSITAEHTVAITFNAIEGLPGNESDCYSFSTVNLKNGYPKISDGNRVYSFINDNASITFTPKYPYTLIKINNSSASESWQTTSSVVIRSIKVYDPDRIFGFRWITVPLSVNEVQIIIDKVAPEIMNIPSMDWTNQDYTINGTATDMNSPDAPSAGMSRAVWSKAQLSETQALEEAVNVAPITDGDYSFTINEEQNNERFYVYAIDNANNVSSAKTINLKIDKTYPQITGFTFQKIEPPHVPQKISFLTTGTFYYDDIEVIVSAKDDGITSGLDEITLYSNGIPIETKAVSGSSTTFRLTLDDFSNNVISASVKDNAGNDSTEIGETKPTDVTTNALSDIVRLRSEAPAISIVPTSEALYTNGGEKWYNSNVGFNVTVSTENVGIYSVTIKVNGQDITTDKNGKAINIDFSDPPTMQESFVINTDYNPLDGENIIEVSSANNCGKVKTSRFKVFIDTTNPGVVGFNINKENGAALSERNFLGYGTFYNQQVKITVIADDRYGAASGIRTITLYADGHPIDGSTKAVTAVGDGTYKAEYILPDSVLPGLKLFDSVISAVATDNVDNVTGKDGDNPNGVPATPSHVNPDMENDRLMIETVDPIIDISAPEAAFTDSASRKWYSDDVSLTITANDLDSGIRSAQIKINDIDIPADSDGKSIDADFYNTETHQEVFSIDTSQGTLAADGSYLIEVKVTDNAGNEYSASEIVYIDLDKPDITGCRFIPASSDGIDETSEFIDFLEYGFYFKSEFNAIIQVSDLGASSGLDCVNYRFVSCQGGTIIGETSGTRNIVDNMAVLTVPNGFKGQIYLEALDSVGNKSSEKTPMGFVIDDTHPEIEVTNNNSTSYRDADSNKLYVSDMSFTVVVSDNGSGIKEIGYVQSDENNLFARKSILIGNTGCHVNDILEDGWVVSEMDNNLVTKASKTFSFSADGNGIMLTLDATDRSGNKQENIQSEKITIDKTDPIINVSFRADDDKDQYYNQNRVADITVIERNFDEDKIRVAIENKYGSVPSFIFIEKSKTEHTAVIEFDEGDYTFDVSGMDLGNHAATVNYSGGNEKLFYVDRTKPDIEENFNEFTNNSEDTFNNDKTVFIKVAEHNFDAALVNLRISRKNAGEAHNESGLVDITSEILRGVKWENSGDVHTITFTLSNDAVYQVEITPTDLAGNAANNRNTVVFEIDKTVPIVKAKNGVLVNGEDIEFLDVYSYYRKDEPAPTVEFEDLNIDHINYSITAYIPDYSVSEGAAVIRPVSVYLNEDNDKSGKIMGSKFTLSNFVKDGVYAIELTAVDVAGNESIVNVNTYARMVEHDVLAYVLESNKDRKTGIYSFQYENGDAISKRPDNFNDIKIFVLAQKDTSVDIVLRDNNGNELITNAKAAVDDSVYGIGIYNFTLEANYFKDNFQDDTDIELHLAVNNEGNRIDLGKMHIDNIAPTCIMPQGFESWHWYYGDNDRTITIINISELIDVDQCKVYDNGKEINFVYSSTDNTVMFTLGKGWHNVGIILYDMAGNANNIQEKVNIHIGFTWLWIIVALSLIFVISVSLVIMRSIQKKRISESEYM